jgi:hypothetical protein
MNRYFMVTSELFPSNSHWFDLCWVGLLKIVILVVLSDYLCHDQWDGCQHCCDLNLGQPIIFIERGVWCSTGLLCISVKFSKCSRLAIGSCCWFNVRHLQKRFTLVKEYQFLCWSLSFIVQRTAIVVSFFLVLELRVFDWVIQRCCFLGKTVRQLDLLFSLVSACFVDQETDMCC